MSDFYTHVYATKRGIHYRGYNNGQRVHELIANYRPSLFIPAAPDEKSPYATLEHKKMSRVKFSNIGEAKEFMAANQMDGQAYLHGNTRFHFTFISDTFEEGVGFDPIEDAGLIRRATLDIETDTSKGYSTAAEAKHPIISITVKWKEKFYVFGLKPYTVTRPDVRYREFPNEKAMLFTFVEFWKKLDLDILLGWNTDQYDIPYIVNRLRKLFGEKAANALSPWGWIRDARVNFRGQQIDTYDILGVSSLDYIDLWRRYMPKSESDSLKFVAEQELGETKVEYEGTLDDLYTKEFQKFIDYNIQDVALVEKLDEKLKLVDMVIATAFDAKCNFQDVQQQVRMWDAISFNMLKKRKIAVPFIEEHVKLGQFAGAHVLSAQVGKHKWVVNIDFESLYPSLIIEHNISPDTLLQAIRARFGFPEFSVADDFVLPWTVDSSFLKDENITCSSTGFAFTKDKQGFLGEILSLMFRDRLKFKNLKKENVKKAEAATDPEEKKRFTFLAERYETLQLAKKVQLNAAYGALGSEYFRYYDLRLACSVTLSGRDILLRTKEVITKRMQEEFGISSDPIIYGDTDSLYVAAKPFVDTLPKTLTEPEIVEQIDKVFCVKLQEYITEAIGLHRKQYNTYAEQLKMVRDVIAGDTIFVSKKRYLMEMWDKEGTRYAEPKRKAVGLEMIKSTTAKFCKQWLHQAADCILKKGENDVHLLVTQFRQEFAKLPLETISFPQNVNGIEAYTGFLSKKNVITFEDTHESNKKLEKGAPIAVAAAFTYNRFLQETGLIKKYEPIKSGVRMRFFYLKEQNPFRSHVIGMLDKIPPELQLEKWVDYEAQFEKVFQKPLNILLGAVGWHKVGGAPSVMGIFD